MSETPQDLGARFPTEELAAQVRFYNGHWSGWVVHLPTATKVDWEGPFDTQEEASAWAEKAKQDYHKPH